MVQTIDQTDPLVSLGRRRRHLAQTQANGGYYISDCHPWNIKAGCTRLDCPMRFQTVAPEAKETDYILQCDPVGDLATFLIHLKLTQP